MKKKKGPPNTPAIGDCVKLRGGDAKGVLRNVNKSTNWSYVNWEVTGPKVCHLFELERVSEYQMKEVTMGFVMISPTQEQLEMAAAAFPGYTKIREI